MSFGVWFRKWIRSFFKLLTSSSKKYKSGAQRKKERERRLKAKYSSANRYRIEKKRRRRRSGHSAQDKRLIGALFKFVSTSLGILLLPFRLLGRRRKSAQTRKSFRVSASSKGSAHHSATKAGHDSSRQSDASAKARKSKSRQFNTIVKTSTTPLVEPEKHNASTHIPYEVSMFDEPKVIPTVEEVESPEELDENAPKSIPKNEKDQYIRKRMIIAGSYYCDQAVLATIEVGAHIELETEPDNPYDKDAVKLLFNGEKIGYVAKQDRLLFATCLKLKRKLYGVITDIINEEGRTKYEYEAWLDNK